MTKKDLFKTAVEVLGSKKAAKKWLETKQIIFGGKRPLDVDFNEVKSALRRMEHGIPQ